ncbi:maternal B9.15 protein isoform X1 [Paramormyrops kingsleyae]|uniref:maternal B9.15 protein isoform X1 n=1 Tax=Paramormyrops kingsleyae TaxID=1676925 RepID=UPI000CD6017A|nr:protein BTG3-like isoform X1 [Paramormyrops kingsleyae]
MRREVSSAVDFLKRLAQHRGGVDKNRLAHFSTRLKELLCSKFAGHWYPENPSRGQAFRCIRINRFGPCDELLQQACEECALKSAELGLPLEFSMWIDPGEVCARLGEGSPCFTVAHFEEEKEWEENKVQEDKGIAKMDKGSPETSDYHSASSSDCGSSTSSDNEEEGKEREMKGEKDEKDTKMDGNTTVKPLGIAMRPRIRAPREPKARISQAASLPCFYHVAPVWSQYKKKSPIFLTAVVPTSSAPMLRYYVLQKPAPQFIIPQATLQPVTCTKE